MSLLSTTRRSSYEVVPQKKVERNRIRDMTIEIPVNDVNPIREDEVKATLSKIFEDIESFRSMYDPSTYKWFAFSVFIPGDLSIEEFDIIIKTLKEGGYHAKKRPSGGYIISCIKNSYDYYIF